jgi:hypothetical protein
VLPLIPHGGTDTGRSRSNAHVEEGSGERLDRSDAIDQAKFVENSFNVVA